MSLEPAALAALDQLLKSTAGVDRVEAVDQLTGGASRQTYAVRAVRSGSGTAGSGGAEFVLQRELSVEPRLAGGMADEADLVRAARRAGVPAPVVVSTNRDGAEALGRSFFITERVPGETIARRILRDDEFAAARQALPGQLGRALAALHTGVRAGDVGWLEVTDELAKYREAADELDVVSPAFELAFRWLEANRPAVASGPKAVVHGDFRLGNLIIDHDGLAAVIDWELGHLGDPMEDLGWLCVRAWRFGGPGPVAGVGDYQDLFSAYEQASGHDVDPAAVRWWETMGTLKWGIMCGMQSNRHLSGDVPSVELAAIGPRVAEQEYDVVRLIHPQLAGVTDLLPSIGSDGGGRGMATGLAEGGGRPSAAQLLEAVREFLLTDVSDATGGRTRFHSRVAANVLATVGRELDLIDQLTERRRLRMAALGFETERELAAAIRSGDLDDRVSEVARAVLASLVDRLVVNNPRWIEPT